MQREHLLWRGVRITVRHGAAPKNRSLYRFAILAVAPANALLPLATPPYGFHYLGKDELKPYAAFADYLVQRFEQDAPPGMLLHNAKARQKARQLRLDL